MTQRLGGVLLAALLATACSRDRATERSSTGTHPSTDSGPTTGTDPATGAAAEPSCDAVVARMVSFSPGAGEKKLLDTACGAMSLAMKSCILAATSRADYDACSKLGGGPMPRP